MRLPKFTVAFQRLGREKGDHWVRNSGQAEAGHSGVLVGGVRAI